MFLKIDSEIFDQYPDLKIGAILIYGIDNSRRKSPVEQLLRGITAQRGREFIETDIHDLPMVRAWDFAYGNFGVNPNKYPPSISALLKRCKDGKEIPHINALVDLYNYFSLKYLLPIGGEDIDWLCGDLHLKFTKGGEAFRPIGSIEVEQAKEGEVAYIDDAGITCRYWNYRECERTKFTNRTRNALVLIEDLSKMHMDQFGEVLRDIQEGIIKYIGGQIEPHILTQENPTLDLKIQGRRNMDDAKVTQQEKIHFMAEELKKKPAKISAGQQDTPQPPKLSQLSDEALFKGQIRELLTQTVKQVFNKDIGIQVEYPADESHGDYASNVALQLSKDLGKPPQEIAKELVKNFPKTEVVGKIDIAGPGFINFFLSQKALENEIVVIMESEEEYGRQNLGEGKRVLIDYSQPNIAKPLGVHHLLSTIIGQSIYNIFDSLGFNTVSINHLGDWGTQFGKLIYAYKQWGNKEVIEKNPIEELLKLYVHFHDEAEKDISLDDKGREEFKKLEDGNIENHQLWSWFKKVSLEEVQKTYDFLGGIHFDYMMGEAFFNDKMDEILEKGKEQEVFIQGQGGSWIVTFENDKYPPYLVQKSDGATLYSTRDLAAINYREKKWNPERILYVVDVAQSLHFQQLFESSRMLGLSDAELVHVVFGRMQFKDKKMSTRKGNIVLLDEVLVEAVKKAREIIEEKNPNLEDDQKDIIAHKVGVGAVKYSVLCQNRNTNIVFDWDKILSLEGNSAPYILYSYARAKSILRKAMNDESEMPEPEKGLMDDEDKDQINEKINLLMREFPKYPEIILNTADEYKPNILCTYLFDLAQKFNSFYNCVPVLKADNEEDKKMRLYIVNAASQILKNGLELLGVETVEEM